MATLSSLPIGAKIKVPHSVMGNVIFLKADQNHTGYPENSTTLITDELILLRAFDAKEPNNTNSSRQKYGNNRYSVSNIDHWLNSTASAGQWYSPQHTADQSPNSTNVSNNPYDTAAGFLNGFDTRFIAAIQDTTIKVARNTVTDGGGYDTLTRKVFLPSLAELFNQAENSIMEGSLLQYFQANTNSIRIAKISNYCAQDNNSHAGSSSVTAGSNHYYWMRTPNSSDSYDVRHIHSDGSLFDYKAYGGSYGVRPLCNLNSETPVSDQPDSDGYYSLLLDATGEIELTYNVKETATMPTAVNVELDLVKTFGCSTTVEICNNGNDTVPAWEDISTVVKSGVNHIFANKTKTADKWKVVIKIHIVRNATVGDIKLYGVKTTFKEEL